jgi:hypothetical protein
VSPFSNAVSPRTAAFSSTSAIEEFSNYRIRWNKEVEDSVNRKAENKSKIHENFRDETPIILPPASSNQAKKSTSVSTSTPISTASRPVYSTVSRDSGSPKKK